MYSKTRILQITGILLLSGLVGIALYSLLDTDQLSSNLHQSAESSLSTGELPLDFFDSNKGRFLDMVSAFKERADLTAPLPTKSMHAAAHTSRIPSFNDYISIKEVIVNNVRDEVDIQFTVETKKLLAEQVSWCPTVGEAGTTLHSSGALLLEQNGNRFFTFQYSIDGEDQSTFITGNRSVRIDAPLGVDRHTFQETISTEGLALGTHTVTVVPTCVVQHPSKTSILEPYIVASPFQKDRTELGSIVAGGSSPLLQLSYPYLSPEQPGQVIRQLEGKRIPYIQTDNTLILRASVDINTYLRDKYRELGFNDLDSKESIDEDSLSVSLLLFNGSKELVASSESMYLSDSPFNTDMNQPFPQEVEFVLPNIPKGNYEAILRLYRVDMQKSPVSTSLLYQTRITDLGIGEVYIVLSEDEINITQLGTELSEAAGHPILVLQQDTDATSWNLDDVALSLSESSFSTDSLEGLIPSGVLLNIPASSLLSLLTENTTLEKFLAHLERTLDRVMGDTPVFMALPQSTQTDQDTTLIREVRSFLTDDTHIIYPGPNLYEASLRNKGDLSSNQLATLWKEALLPYLDTSHMKESVSDTL